MKKSFVLGFLTGIIACFVIYAFTLIKSKNVYVTLNSNYKIDTIGFLKKGTILKVDEGMSEGFTRYILYLNLSDGEKISLYKTEHPNEIIPYWLINDSLKSK